METLAKTQRWTMLVTEHRAALNTERSATIEFERTWLSRPQDWALRIVGHSIGGYGYIDHSTRDLPTARFCSKEAAEQAATIWIETGLTPSAQTDERVAAVRGELARRRMAERSDIAA